MIKILEQVCKNIYDWKIPFAWNFRCRKRALTYLYLFNNKIWIKLNNWPLRHGKMVFWLQSENLYQEKLISCRDVKQKCSSFTKFHRKIKLCLSVTILDLIIFFVIPRKSKEKVPCLSANRSPAEKIFLVLDNSKKLTNYLSAHVCHIFIFSFKSLKYSVHVDLWTTVYPQICHIFMAKKNWGQIGVWQIGRCTVFAFILYKFSFNHYLEIVEIHEKSF